MASESFDLTFLDRPEILQMLFYPRRDYPTRLSPEAATHFIAVEPGVRIACRFYGQNPAHPTFLYFHGNGETAGDHDWIAPVYKQMGINLFVTDYRGYGQSDGWPTISGLVGDAHPIFEAFGGILKQGGYSKGIFIMGRSLGSIPAIELALHYQERLQGLIIESGSANNFLRLMTRLGISAEEAEQKGFSNKAKMRSIGIPTLLIHAERDTIIPLREGIELYENAAATDKRFIIIPNADHNDLLLVAPDLYFGAIQEFVGTHQAEST